MIPIRSNRLQEPRLRRLGSDELSHLPQVAGRVAWRDYAQLYRPQWKQVGFAIALSIAPSGLLAAAAILVRKIFDVAIAQRDIRLLVLLVCSVAVLQLTSYAIMLFSRSIVLVATKNAIARLRERMLETMLSTSRRFFDSGTTGSLHNVIVDDSERVDVMSNMVITTLLPASASAITLGVVLFISSPRLFLVLALIGPIAMLTSRTMARLTRATIREFHDSFRGFSAGVASSLRAIDLTRSQTAEEHEMRETAMRIADVRETSHRTSWMQTAMVVVHHGVMTIGGAVVLLAGGVAIIEGAMSLGELASFVVAMMLLRTQLQPIATFGTHILSGHEALTRLYGLIHHAPPEPYRGTGRVDFDGDIALESVTFGYAADRPVLRDVSMKIDSGKVVALVGANGAGKSTILRLILGFYAPQQGSVTAAGRPYEALDVRELRRSFGIVLQDSLILDASIRQNIVYGLDDVSDEDLDQAARLAGADAMITSLPDGYDTHVGEDGALLSGGQRQRIAIARALLRRPRLLILDEPTRHLDRAAVDVLLRTIRDASWPHSTLVVTHDEPLAAKADEVYLVNGGNIVRQERAGLAGRA